MMFTDGFGEEQVVEHNGLRDGYDRIVPNNLLDQSSTELINQWTDFQPVVYALRQYIEVELSLAVHDDVRDRQFETALLDDGTTIALKAVIDGHPQYFPSPVFFQRLQDSEESIVRFTGSPEPRFARIKVDTRDRDFKIRPPEHAFDTDTFKREYTERETLTTDFVTAPEGLVGLRKEGYNDVVSGTVAKCRPLIEYVEDQFDRDTPPFNIQTIETCFYRSETVIAGTRVHKEHGQELFLTKQGFDFLAGEGLAVIRAERGVEQEQWTGLTVVFHPEMFL